MTITKSLFMMHDRPQATRTVDRRTFRVRMAASLCLVGASTAASAQFAEAALAPPTLMAMSVHASPVKMIPSDDQTSTKSSCGAALLPDEVSRRLNAARASGAVCHRHGLMVGDPIHWSDSLAKVALSQSREMVLLRQMGHRDSRNRGLGERLRASDYVFSSAVENVAVGYPSLDDVVAAWLGSEGHCDNLMNQSVVEFGLACSEDAELGSAGEGRYWSLVLGAPKRRGSVVDGQ